MNKKLSLVLAFYNEKYICESYKKISTFLKRDIPQYELLLVNDGSTNSSVEQLKTLIKRDKKTRLISYKPNRGRGYAVTQGFKAAKGDYIAYLDSDLEISPIHLLDLLKRLKEYDVVIGNKFLPQSRVKTRKVRKFASFVFNTIIRIFLQSKVQDHHVGIKGFRKKVIQLIIPYVKEERWAFDVEILYLVQKKRFSIGYIPITMTYGMEGIKLSYVRYFKDLFFFILATKKRYKKLLR